MLLPSGRIPFTLGILGIGCLIFALALFSVTAGPAKVLAVLVGLLFTVVVLTRPFAGLFILVLIVQLSAIIDRFSPVAFTTEGLVVLTLAGTIINSTRLPKKIRWGGSSSAFRMACLFIITAAISSMYAEHPDSARFGLIQLTGLLIIFFMILTLAQTPQRIKALLSAIMLSTAISASIAIIGNQTGHVPFGLDNVSISNHQAGAASVSPTTSANMMLVGTVIGMLLALRSTKWRMLGFLTAIIGTSGIIITLTRSAAALLAAGCVWLGVKFRHARHFPAIMLISLLLGIAILPFLPQQLWERFEKVSDPAADWTLGRRIGYHMIGLDLVARNPLLGVGPNNFREHYTKYEYRWIEGRQLETRALHNMYLMTAAETGLLGFGFFSAMILLSLIGLQKTRQTTSDPELKMLAEAVQFGYVLFLIAAAALPAITNKYTWILTGLAAAITSIARQPEKRFRTNPDNLGSGIDAENPSY